MTTLQLLSARLAEPVDADDDRLDVIYRARIEEEIVHIVSHKKQPGRDRTRLKVLRGMEGTEAVDHPEGAELEAL